MIRETHELQIAGNSVTITLSMISLTTVLSITYPKVLPILWPLSDSILGGSSIQPTVAILTLCLDVFNIKSGCHMQICPQLPSFLTSNLLTERLTST